MIEAYGRFTKASNQAKDSERDWLFSTDLLKRVLRRVGGEFYVELRLKLKRSKRERSKRDLFAVSILQALESKTEEILQAHPDL